MEKALQAHTRVSESIYQRQIQDTCFVLESSKVIPMLYIRLWIPTLRASDDLDEVKFKCTLVTENANSEISFARLITLPLLSILNPNRKPHLND